MSKDLPMMGQDGMLKLASILGMEEAPLQEMIVVFKIDEPVRVYSKQLIGEEQFDDMLNLMIELKPKTAPKTKKLSERVNCIHDFGGGMICIKCGLSWEKSLPTNCCEFCGSKQIDWNASVSGNIKFYTCQSCGRLGN